MLSIKSIKLPSIHVDFLLLCSCQVSSHSEYFIIIYVSLMSHVGGKTPISDHREIAIDPLSVERSSPCSDHLLKSVGQNYQAVNANKTSTNHLLISPSDYYKISLYIIDDVQ